jgi:hypothetical protein
MEGFGNGRGRTDLGAQVLVLHNDDESVNLQPSKDERLRYSNWRVGWSCRYALPRIEVVFGNESNLPVKRLEKGGRVHVG